MGENRHPALIGNVLNDLRRIREADERERDEGIETGLARGNAERAALVTNAREEAALHRARGQKTIKDVSGVEGEDAEKRRKRGEEDIANAARIEREIAELE